MSKTLNAALLLSALACAKSYADSAEANSYATRYDNFTFSDETKYQMSCNVWGYDNLDTSKAWDIKCFTWATPSRNNWGIKWVNIATGSNGNATDVKAYPSVRMGYETGGSSSDGLPYSLASGKDVAIYWDFSLTGSDGTGNYTGVINCTMDMFLCHNSTDNVNHDYEIMIMPYYTSGQSQTQTIAYNVSVGGYQWDIHKYTMTGFSGASWPVYQYKAAGNNNFTSMHIHLKDFTDDIKSRYYPNGSQYASKWDSQYMQSVDGGVEIKWGDGKLVTSQYKTDVYQP